MMLFFDDCRHAQVVSQQQLEYLLAYLWHIDEDGNGLYVAQFSAWGSNSCWGAVAIFRVLSLIF